MIGVVVGACDPASGSTVTATTPNDAISTGPERMWNASPEAPDVNTPAGLGAPPLGISHISKIRPAGNCGRFAAIIRTPLRELTNTFPRGPFSNPTCLVSG